MPRMPIVDTIGYHLWYAYHRNSIGIIDTIGVDIIDTIWYDRYR